MSKHNHTPTRATLAIGESWRLIYPAEKPYGTRAAFYRNELGAPEPLLTQLKEAQQLLRAKPGRPKKGEGINSSNTRISPLGKKCDAAYIRARLERDGKSELLAQIDRGEISARAAAIEAKYRHPMIQHQPTVKGFLRAATRWLPAADRLRLKDEL